MILSASRFLLWATGTRQVTFGGKTFGVSDETAFIFLFKLGCFWIQVMEIKCSICWKFSSWASKTVKMYIRSFSGRRENVTVEEEEWYTSTEIFNLLTGWFGDTYAAVFRVTLL